MASLPALPDSAVRDMRDAVLRALPDIEALYVFGSHARDDARPQSDLDLAVLGAAPLDPLHRFEVQRDLSVMLDIDVDLIDLRTASSALRSKVIHGGKALFQRDPERVPAFEAGVLGEYADLLDATRSLRESARERAGCTHDQPADPGQDRHHRTQCRAGARGVHDSGQRLR